MAAGRFVVQKLAASISRSRTLLRAHDGASSVVSAGGGAPSTRTLSHLLHGPSAIQPAGSSSAAPNKLGIIHGCGAICRIPSNVSSARGGADRAFSSSTSGVSVAGHEIGAEEATRAWQAEWDAFDARMAAGHADFNKFMRKQKLLVGFACVSFAVGLVAEELTRHVRDIKAQRVPSGCCSGCSRPLRVAGDKAHKAKAV